MQLITLLQVQLFPIALEPIQLPILTPEPKWVKQTLLSQWVLMLLCDEAESFRPKMWLCNRIHPHNSRTQFQYQSSQTSWWCWILLSA